MTESRPSTPSGATSPRATDEIELPTLSSLARDDLLLRALVGATAAGLLAFLAVPADAYRLWGALALVGLVAPPALAALFFGVTRRPARRERIFWHLVGVAVLCWWLAALVELVGPRGAGSLWQHGLHCAGLLGLLLALEARPDLNTTIGRSELLDALADTLLVGGLFAYFLLVPALSGTTPNEPTTWRLTAVVGALLLVRLVTSARATRATRPRWAVLYTGISCVVLLVILGDCWLTLAHRGTVPEVLPAAWRLLPVAVLGTLGRISTTRFAADSHGAPPERVTSPLLLYGLSIPLLHLALHISDLADPAHRMMRDLLVFVTLSLVGALMVIESSVLRRRSTELETSRRDAVREAKSQSLYLRSLIEHSPLAIVVLDPEHRVEMSNPAFERLFGYRNRDIVKRSLDELIATRQTAAEAADYTRKVLAGETVHRFARRRRRDGSEVEVEIHGVPLLRDGDLVGIFALYQDVTERLRAEERLRESEERFRRLSDATFEGIVLSERDRIVDCNEQYATMVGLKQHEVVGRDVLEFVAPADRKLVALRMREGFEQPYEHRALTADGAERLVEVHGRSITHGERSVRVTAVRDVTESRRFEDQVRQTQKMEAVGRLAGGIAHDFNNVLTVIKGYSQLLSFRLDDGAAAHQVREIQQAADRASLMTQRLLAFGRKQALQPQILDLGQVVGDMEEMLRRLIRADIELRVETLDDLGRVQADPGQLEQVLLNLAINARDAMPQGGVLHIATRNVDVEQPQATLAAGSYVELAVSDTGVGMDETTRRQVFEPFFTTKSKDEGTGLGLATVYAIVQQNGGTIEVDSRPGEGATFRLLLPRVPERSTPDEPAHAFADLPRGDETILVVEDEAGVRALAVEFLEGQGYRVEAAADGRDALRLIESLGRVDLVLTDVIMPGLNGPEMAEQVVAQRPATKVLFMSGYTDEALGWHDPEIAARLVQKPFSVEELVVKVRETLDEQPAD
ncbi:MAG: PAS domain S-box protein [Acidobacteriota bacterium]